MNEENVIRRQIEFCEWLKSHGMYNQFESAATMCKLQQVWELSTTPRKYSSLEKELATLKAQLAERAAVPDEISSILLNVADNLNDLPINDDWAKTTVEKILQLLPEPLKAAPQSEGVNND